MAKTRGVDDDDDGDEDNGADDFSGIFFHAFSLLPVDVVVDDDDVDEGGTVEVGAAFAVVAVAVAEATALFFFFPTTVGIVDTCEVEVEAWTTEFGDTLSLLVLVL